MPEKDDRDGAAVKLTILMPVYNEAETVQQVLKRLLANSHSQFIIDFRDEFLSQLAQINLEIGIFAG